MLTEDRFKRVCEQAVEKFGKDIQIIIAMEECGELIQALSKKLRGQVDNVEEEIADVQIMLQQLSNVFDSSLIDEWKEKKINRLENRLKE